MYASAVIAAIAAALVSANNQPAQAKAPQAQQGQQNQQNQQSPQAKEEQQGRGHGCNKPHGCHKPDDVVCDRHVEYVYLHKKPCRRPRYFCPPRDCSVCPKEFGELFVVNDEVPFYSADCACKAKGGRLAQVSSANFNNAVSAVFECVGPNKHAWVESWNGDNYNNACLALYTGSQPGGGSIAVPLSCESKVPILCQKVHQECHNNDCWDYVWELEESHGLGGHS